jgi:hypothetical protein
MTASFLASFLIFAVTGVYELYFGRAADFLRGKPLVQGTILAVLFLNACYYYYIAAYTELDKGMRAKLDTASRGEWVVRVLNQTILFALWFLLHLGWLWFAWGLIVLYLTYFLWDFLTWKNFPSHGHVIIDLLGLIVTCALFIVRPYATVAGPPQAPITASTPGVASVATPVDEMTIGFSLGLIAIFYIVIFGFGVWRCHFKPWSPEYWVRPVLH